MKHFLDVCDFPLARIMELIEEAYNIKADMDRFSKLAGGKILGTMFFEPSTRTRLSFETAMIRLGGQVVSFGNFENSSVSKGESFRDTIKVMSSYVDLIALRHPLEGAARAASLFSNCPIINSGDGSHLHPTQTLADLLTIFEQKKSFSNLTFGFCGDLKFGRTVHSLVKILAKFGGNTFIFISTDKLKIPDYFKKEIVSFKNEYFETDSIESFIKDLDVMYMTRIQRERFKKLEDYFEQSKTSFKLTLNLLEKSKDDLIVLHPLPRVDEINYSVDESPKAKYFEQARNGVFVRMALIERVLFGCFDDSFEDCLNFNLEKICCRNENCITNFERYLPKKFRVACGEKFCYYCDGKTG